MPKPRKPAALKLMQGTDQPCRVREEVDYQLVTEMEPPYWLCDDEAVAEWHRLLAELIAAGIMATTDRNALGYYCNMHARAVRKWEIGGQPTAAETNQVRMMLNEFGLTPTSRGKPVKAGGEVAKNPFDEFALPGLDK